MSISQKINNNYKKQIKIIKNMNNSNEKNIMVGSLIKDIGGRCIGALSKTLNMCRKKLKSCHNMFLYGLQQKLEFRGRKSVTVIYPNFRYSLD